MSASIPKDSGVMSSQHPMAFEEIRKIVIRELRAESLSSGEQDKLMQMVGEALVERATYALMKSAPPDLLIELGEDGRDVRTSEDAAFFMKRLAETIPNAQTIVVDAIKAGLRDYQEYLDNELGTVGKQSG